MSKSKSNFNKEYVVIPVSKINRTLNYSRVEIANCQDLAEAIKDCGLLQPIGVTPSETAKGKVDAVFGNRRLTAVDEILGKKDIEAFIYTNKDGSSLNEAQRAEINAIENSTQKRPAALELGYAILTMANAGKGVTTIAHIFRIAAKDCQKILTAWRTIPQKFLDQVIPNKKKTDPGLSLGHIYKVASVHRNSFKLPPTKINDALQFVVDHIKPISTTDFGRALNTFITTNGKSFEEIYSAVVKNTKVTSVHKVSISINDSIYKKNFKDLPLKNFMDVFTDSTIRLLNPRVKPALSMSEREKLTSLIYDYSVKMRKAMQLKIK